MIYIIFQIKVVKISTKISTNFSIDISTDFNVNFSINVSMKLKCLECVITMLVEEFIL